MIFLKRNFINFFIFSTLIYCEESQKSFEVSLKKGFNTKIILPFSCSYFIDGFSNSASNPNLEIPNFCQILQNSVSFNESLNYKQPASNLGFSVFFPNQVLTIKNDIYFVNNFSNISHIKIINQSNQASNSSNVNDNSTFLTPAFVPQVIINQNSTLDPKKILSLHFNEQYSNIVSCSFPIISVLKNKEIGTISYFKFSLNYSDQFLVGCHENEGIFYLLFNSSAKNLNQTPEFSSLLQLSIRDTNLVFQNELNFSIPGYIEYFSFYENLLYVKFKGTSGINAFNLINSDQMNNFSLPLADIKVFISKGSNIFYSVSNDSREMKELLIENNTTTVNSIKMISDIKSIYIDDSFIYVLQENLISLFPRNITIPSQAMSMLKSSITLEGVDLIAEGFPNSIIAFKGSNISLINLVKSPAMLQCKPTLNESANSYAGSLQIYEFNICLDPNSTKNSWKVVNFDMTFTLYMEYFESSNIALGIGLGIGLSFSFILSIVFCVCYFRMKGRYKSLTDNISDKTLDDIPQIKDEEAQKLQFEIAQ